MPTPEPRRHISDPATLPPLAPLQISARARTLTLVAMTLANSMILIDQTAVPIAVPRIMDSLGGSISDGQWVLIANVLPLGALMILGGRLGDLFGLRRVFLAGAVLFISSSALVGAAPNVPWLLFLTLFLAYLHGRFFDLVGNRGLQLSGPQVQAGTDFVMQAEQEGLGHVSPPPGVAGLYPESPPPTSTPTG